MKTRVRDTPIVYPEHFDIDSSKRFKPTSGRNSAVIFANEGSAQRCCGDAAISISTIANRKLIVVLDVSRCVIQIRYDIIVYLVRYLRIHASCFGKEQFLVRNICAGCYQTAHIQRYRIALENDLRIEDTQYLIIFDTYI